MMTDLELELKRAINALDKIPKLIEENEEIIKPHEWEYYLDQIRKIDNKIYKIKLILLLKDIIKG